MSTGRDGQWRIYCPSSNEAKATAAADRIRMRCRTNPGDDGAAAAPLLTAVGFVRTAIESVYSLLPARFMARIFVMYSVSGLRLPSAKGPAKNTGDSCSERPKRTPKTVANPILTARTVNKNTSARPFVFFFSSRIFNLSRDTDVKPDPLPPRDSTF